MAIARHDFPTKEALADALAGHVADALTARLARTDRAALAVSGGRTPTRFFEALSQKPVEWSRVDVTLVDERWVGEESDRSNAALVRQHLLQGPAAAANFVPLHIDAPTPEDGMARVFRGPIVLDAAAAAGMGVAAPTPPAWAASRHAARPRPAVASAVVVRNLRREYTAVSSSEGKRWLSGISAGEM